DRVEHLLREHRLDRHVHSRHVNSLPASSKDYARGLRIEPEIELVARARCKLRVIGLRVYAAAHYDDASGQLRELGIDRHRKGNIGQRTGSVDRHLSGMRPDLADQEVGSIFSKRLSL